ncbi:hypothetical protein ES705_29550 [subsurface metagenome]|nr:hypothetical protein [Clostridia bacterium]
MGNLKSKEKISPGIIAADRRDSLKRGISRKIGFVDKRVTPDRRISKRSIIAFPVEIEVLSLLRKTISKIKGETHNISGKGLSVASKKPFPCGVVANIYLSLSSHSPPIRAKVLVIWTGFSPKENKFLSGLYFLGLSDDCPSIISDSRSMRKGEKRGLRIRQARSRDIKEILRIEKGAWPKELRATKEMFHSRLKTFPEGFLCAVVNGEIQGFVVTEILDYDIQCSSLSWQQATDHGYIRKTHNPNGDTLYGVSLSVSARAQRRVAVALLEATGKLVIKYGLKQGVFGSRIPRYHRYAAKMPVEEYIKAKTRTGRLLDPELGIYQSVGLRPVRIIPGYIRDPESLDYGILAVWENPFLDLTELFPFWAQLISSSFKVIRRYK